MALEAAIGTIAWATSDTVGTDLTVSGLSFQPKAIMLFGVGRNHSSDVVGGRDADFVIGFATSTTSRSVNQSVIEDGVDDEQTWMLSDACFLNNLNGISDELVVGRLDLQSFESDGFVLNVDVVAMYDVIFGYIAWGGSDLTASDETALAPVTADAPTIDYTGAGLQPDAVLFHGCANRTAGALIGGDAHFQIKIFC